MLVEVTKKTVSDCHCAKYRKCVSPEIAFSFSFLFSSFVCNEKILKSMYLAQASFLLSLNVQGTRAPDTHIQNPVKILIVFTIVFPERPKCQPMEEGRARSGTTQQRRIENRGQVRSVQEMLDLGVSLGRGSKGTALKGTLGLMRTPHGSQHWMEAWLCYI